MWDFPEAVITVIGAVKMLSYVPQCGAAKKCRLIQITAEMKNEGSIVTLFYNYLKKYQKYDTSSLIFYR